MKLVNHFSSLRIRKEHESYCELFILCCKIFHGCKNYFEIALEFQLKKKQKNVLLFNNLL